MSPPVPKNVTKSLEEEVEQLQKKVTQLKEVIEVLKYSNQPQRPASQLISMPQPQRTPPSQMNGNPQSSKAYRPALELPHHPQWSPAL
jgi:hypothetical protein